MTEIKPLNLKFNLVGLELLEYALTQKKPDFSDLKDIQFKITMTSQVDRNKKLNFVITNVEIYSADLKNRLASITVSCVFHIENFEDLIIEDQKKLSFPQPIVDTMSSISLSTVRGIMFSTFSGSYLHFAILPLIATSSLGQPQEDMPTAP